MADGKLSIGQIWTPPPTNVWNAMVEAGLAWIRERGGQRPAVSVLVDPSRLTVKNNSGSTVLAGRVLEAGAKRLTTIDRRQLWFSGDTPAADGTKIWGVAEYPIPSTVHGEIVVCGLAVARVTVNHASHTHADVADGSTTLVSGFHGVPIVYKQSGTGTFDDCVVRLGSYHVGPVDIVNDGLIAFDDDGTVSVWLDGTDSGANETAWLDWMHNDEDLAANNEAMMFWFPRRQRWGIRNAGCG